jgi:hypothetical protein
LKSVWIGSTGTVLSGAYKSGMISSLIMDQGNFISGSRISDLNTLQGTNPKYPSRKGRLGRCLTLLLEVYTNLTKNLTTDENNRIIVHNC